MRLGLSKNDSTDERARSALVGEYFARRLRCVCTRRGGARSKTFIEQIAPKLHLRGALKSRPLNYPVRLSTVVLLMIAWLVATNHCALGLMGEAREGQPEHSHCCAGRATPTQDTPAEERRECCKTIHAASVPDTVAAKFDATKVQLQQFVLVASTFEAAQRTLPGLASEHGPPIAVSFAESVLQRSLFAHAPPLAV